MQVLESLSDSQVNDFLSGKTPLQLTMRLGDHMMLIQLQLSTVTPSPLADRSSGPSTSVSSSLSESSPTTTSSSTETITSNHGCTSSSNRKFTVLPPTRSTSSSTKFQHTTRTSYLINNLDSTDCNISTVTTKAACSERTTPSPSKSSTTPVSSPHSMFCPQSSPPQQPRTSSAPMSPPPSGASSNSTSSRQSCLLHHHHHHHSHHHHHHHHHHPHHMRKALSLLSSTSNSTDLSPSTFISGCSDLSSASSLRDDDSSPQKEKLCNGHHHQQQQQNSSTSSSSITRSFVTGEACPSSSADSGVGIIDVGKGAMATLDTRALAEASRNLTQKLKQLSSEVFTSRGDLAEVLSYRSKFSTQIWFINF